MKLKYYKLGICHLLRTYIFSLDRTKLGYCGKNVTLIPPLYFSKPSNVFLYGDNGLNDAKIYTNNAKFIMKAHSGAAEGLRVSTGNHAMVLGKFYRSITEAEKPYGLDKDVIIESDVWIGRNVILLQGVHVGRGCTVGAGSVVTKSLPPYTICVGNPCRPIKLKWSLDEILEHETGLYEENERFSREELLSIMSELSTKYHIHQ